MKKVSVAVAVLLIFSIALCGCSGSNAITGHWEAVEYEFNGERISPDLAETLCECDINEDGTMKFFLANDSSGTAKDNSVDLVWEEKEQGEYVMYMENGNDQNPFLNAYMEDDNLVLELSTIGLFIMEKK